jgi:threonine dehydratase
MFMSKYYSPDDFIKQIDQSKVYEVADVSPLEYAFKSSTKLGINVYLKREDLQPIHSFKIRGAYNKMLTLTQKEKKTG